MAYEPKATEDQAYRIRQEILTLTPEERRHKVPRAIHFQDILTKHQATAIIALFVSDRKKEAVEMLRTIEMARQPVTYPCVGIVSDGNLCGEKVAQMKAADSNYLHGKVYCQKCYAKNKHNFA